MDEELPLLCSASSVHRNTNFFNEYSYIDSIVKGEGELAGLEILTAYLDKRPLEQVYEFDRIQDLNLPSPYTSGLFDDLLKQHHLNHHLRYHLQGFLLIGL